MSISDLVVLRVWKDNGEAFALFPMTPADHTGRFCTSYQHVGQHGSGRTIRIASATVGRLPTPKRPRCLQSFGLSATSRRTITRASYIKTSTHNAAKLPES